MLAAIVRISSPWLRAWGVVLACLCLVACDDVAPGDPVLDGGEDAGSDATAFDGLTFDIRPLDRPRADAAEVGSTGLYL